jgi:hypothetical protein
MLGHDGNPSISTVKKLEQIEKLNDDMGKTHYRSFRKEN